MKKILFMLCIVTVLVIAGCKTQVSCTAEAKICPDGSAVGRTGPNCEFAACPSNNTQIANPASVNCVDKGGTLKILEGPGGQYGMCTLADGTECEEWAYFRGECPNGCSDSDDGKEYFIKGLSKTMFQGEVTFQQEDTCAIRQGTSFADGFRSCNGSNCYVKESFCGILKGANMTLNEYFLCPSGCGDGACCEPCPAYTPPGPDYCKGGEIIVSLGVDECGCSKGAKCMEKQYCTPESRKAEACISLYDPVCGWFSQDIKCIKYPCAITSGNSCEACINPNVEYWTQGECPK